MRVLYTMLAAFAAFSSVVKAIPADDGDSNAYKPDPTHSGPFRALTYLGCFDSAKPMKDLGMYKFVTSGKCQQVCYQEKAPIMGLTDGTNCWCGDLIPMKNAMVDNSTCDTPCSGFEDEMCGGPSLWSVYNTGYSRNRIAYYEDKSSSSSSSSSSTPAPTSSSTETADSQPKEEEKSSGSTVGIVVGVVAGVVGLFAIGGGIWWFLRRRAQDKDEKDPFYNDTVFAQMFPGGTLDHRKSNGSIKDELEGAHGHGMLRVTNA